MKYYLVAGERSGDLHGSNLIKGIKKQDENAVFRGWGGDLMKSEGMDLVTHYESTAFMGFGEVIRNLPTIFTLLQKCKEDILAFKPDCLILIDYPGFNLRIAKFAKKRGIRVIYYISPKVWAWNQDRAYGIKRNVDHLFVIFPFEIDFYKKYDYNVEYLGNPLMDAIAAFLPDPEFRKLHKLGDSKIVAVLPGSRMQEVKNMLDLMLAITHQFPEYVFIVAAVKNIPPAFYEKYAGADRIKLIWESAYDILGVSEAALVTSGTATLETALLNVPEVVCYKTSILTYHIARRLIRVKFLSLVNLISGKAVVKELIQNELNPKQLTVELKAILPGGARRPQILDDYANLQKAVGGPGASERVGERIVEIARNDN